MFAGNENNRQRWKRTRDLYRHLRKSEIKLKLIYLYGTMNHEMIKHKISHKSNLISN